MLALTVFTMMRRPPLAGWTGGLAVVTKQYWCSAVPLLVRFAARRSGGGTVRFGLRGVFAGALRHAAVCAVARAAFLESVVFLQTREPFRSDSLSYLSWAAREGWGTGSFVWAVAAACIALIISAARNAQHGRRVRRGARSIVLRDVCLRFQGVLQLLLLRRRCALLRCRGSNPTRA